jgi:ribonuclease Y
MDPNILSIIIGAGALIIGLVAGKLIFAKNTRKKIEEAEKQSQTILKETELRAETIRKEKELEAKEKFVQMRSAHEKEVNERSRKINDREPHPSERTNHQPERRQS